MEHLSKSFQMKPNPQIELAIDLKSPCCAGKVEKVVQEIEGVKSVKVDPAKKSVVVEGDVVAEKVKDVIEKKTGIFAAIMGLGSSLNENLGSAVAAIAVGSSSVRGVLRMNQIDHDTCVIEGTLDGLPDSDNLYVSLHESGNLTKGCDSCGSLYSLDNGKNDDIGFLIHLKPYQDRSIQFRCASSQLKVDDLYGMSLVVHDGDIQQIKENMSNRLACGIVARSSGMYQNSKRFCACDGVNLWEEKKKIAGVGASS